ncbi:MAG: sulfotransferase [Alphaproteobacteria bacterium]|nr:sulfotransferase [Alphaproteobacteria bacterium]
MAQGLGRRARTMAELGANMAALEPQKLENFRPIDAQPSDVFITCWAKSGTTMMQQMFHQLRMGAATGAGDMDFDDISRVVPWEDTARMLDFDMTAPQRAAPRGFKSHREYERLPAGSRYVVTLRDPKETFVSFYRFFDGWHIERGALSMEEFFPIWMLGGPGGCNYFTHTLSWWARRDAPDTLLATYTKASSNRAWMIRRLAAFLGIELTDTLQALVERHTSRDFMHAHRNRFDDAMMCVVMEERLGIPADSDSTKVQEKGSDAGAAPQSVCDRIDALWAERVAPVTGHADFASLAAELDGRG